ncbi:uncharacterized protein LOC135809836 [Sycon ciliatum]|uniref:uncharacterized protein LOC135809836 n=1 Tax=Sycon ciliatum TaxID=27933 RepID=UPI0031F71250
MQEDVAEQQSSNVMESRDSILAYFRKNHLEFTTLRHAQYATLCMLIELQSQCNVIVYRCNTCIAEIIGSRFHCPVCDAFLTITLISSEKVANLKPMQEDVCEQQSVNVMESRDSILAYFRQNHLEFTTLRHAQYATLCMLIELQSQCNVIVYRCNTCIAEIIGSRFHCPVCDAFFTITLISSEKVANLKPMQEDVAEQQSSNVMESRDSILAYFRKNHLEFTTLRHAQYATLCMLIELQSQCNVIVYRCNTCIAEIIGSRFHCPVCDAFFTITLISSEKVADFELMEEDVDELQSGNMMECRDSFLAYCRTNHLEFSTLRHAQYATLCMLIELQSQCNENVIGYRCNTCMAEIIGSRFHCPECKDFYLVLSAIRNAAMIT